MIGASSLFLPSRIIYAVFKTEIIIRTIYLCVYICDETKSCEPVAPYMEVD